MEFVGAAVSLGGCVEPGSCRVATGVTADVAPIVEQRLAWMVFAMRSFASIEEHLANSALKQISDRIGPPKEHPPRYSFLDSEIVNELFVLESSVGHMLCNHSSVGIDEDFRFLADEIILCKPGEQLVAVGATLKTELLLVFV